MRRTDLRRSTPLHRKTPLRKRNARRLKRLRAKQFGPQAALCRTLPCCCCKAPPPSDPHHLKSRGAGGDDSSCVPLCRRCHSALHCEGPSFWSRMRVGPDLVLGHLRRLVLDENDLPVALSLGRPLP